MMKNTIQKYSESKYFRSFLLFIISFFSLFVYAFISSVVSLLLFGQFSMSDKVSFNLKLYSTPSLVAVGIFATILLRLIIQLGVITLCLRFIKKYLPIFEKEKREILILSTIPYIIIGCIQIVYLIYTNTLPPTDSYAFEAILFAIFANCFFSIFCLWFLSYGQNKNLIQKTYFVATFIFIVTVGSYFLEYGNQIKFEVSKIFIGPIDVVYTTTTPRDVDWEASIPAIRNYLRKEFMGIQLEKQNPITIYKTGDITGDGISEAIIDLGRTGPYEGSSTFMKLMTVENNKLVVTEFKGKYGGYFQMESMVGSGMNKITDAVLLPSKNVYYEIIKDTSATSSILFRNFCGIDAYQWNLNTKGFDFNQKLSDEIKADVCK